MTWTRATCGGNLPGAHMERDVIDALTAWIEGLDHAPIESRSEGRTAASAPSWPGKKNKKPPANGG